MKIDLRSEPDGRVSMNRFTFGAIIASRPPRSDWQHNNPRAVRFQNELQDEIDRVFYEAYEKNR